MCRSVTVVDEGLYRAATNAHTADARDSAKIKASVLSSKIRCEVETLFVRLWPGLGLSRL